MGTHDETERGTAPLTTEDLADPGSAGAGPGTGPAVYPGEATGEDLSGGSAAGREDEGFGAADEADEEISGSGRAVDGSPGPAGEASAGAGTDGSGDGQPLLATGDAERFRTAWSEIQGRFVDDPREAVTSADTLVAEVMQSLAGTFASHKQELEGQWQRGDDVATEDLRQALQHYRSFFNRLLNA
ncbi:hypothetical protein GCM10010302_25840 [Streptomyces polychromogenes]|uniref:Uncharacterized protein n=1 Tax=Streptomyces polychromogenes TaxID=67342 RepID=A0ABN0VCA1_9ACTN